MNGILSNVAKYTQDTKFQILGNDGISTFGKKLSFKGVDGADIVVKYIRTYNGVMSPDDVVNNYILFRDNSRDMLSLFTQNNVMNEQGIITPESILKWGNIPVIIFIGRTKTTLEGKEIKSNYAPGAGEGEENNGEIILDDKNWYQTLENTTDKKEVVNMDVIYCNPLNPEKNFKFVNAYITPQGTSSMYYPKKNYRIYTQKNNNTRCFFSISKEDQLTYDMMKRSDFGVRADEFKYEPFPGIANKKKRVYSFKDNAQAVKCWCLKADFAETSSSHNTGIARLWGDTLKNSTIKFGEDEIRVFETTAQATIRNKFKNNINGDMPDIRTTIDGFPIVVFGARSYDDPMTFLGQYNFNNDKSTESVFGFCDIDDDEPLSHTGKNNITGEETEITHTLDDMLDQYMTCVETLDNGNLLANFATLDTFSDITEIDKNQNNIYGWEKAFEFRYPEKPDKKDYKNDESGFNEDYTKWHNTHVKPFKHFAEWLYSTRWCDVNGHILPGLSKEEASARKEKFAKEKWDHLDIWKMAAYYIYAMRFGAVDQIVKNSMLTAEGPFARDLNGKQYGHLDTTDITNDKYGLYYKWYYINYDNDTIMGVKNDGHLAYGPEINRKSVEGENNFPIYAGSNSTLWNNLDADEEFQSIVEKADQGLSENLTYNATINMFDVQQVGKWCERIYNKDAEYKYITPYVGGWLYRDDEGNTSEDAGNFADKLFMLQGARTAHRRWWLSRRFSLYDGKWGAGDFLTKYIEVKCDYSSIGDTFSAVAGANAFFGYRINGQTFDNGSSEGGSTTEYKAKDIINWKLFKNINIGDPIALYGANDMVELNLQGLSTGLATLMFQFGNNADLGNKMERLILSIPEESLLRAYSYRVYGDDDTEQTDSLTAFEKFQRDFPNVTEKDFEDNNLTMDGEIEANETSPSYYRILENEKYIYFGKFGGGVRNSSCTALTLNNLTKLQTLKIAGYIGLGKLDLSNNNSLSELDARYSGIKTLSFNNSKIKNLSASTALEELYVNSCDNLKLSNISIDSTSLEYNKGVNLKVISVEKSTGLNTNNSFKNFIIKWVNGGDEFVDITNKKLILNDIYWTGISMKDIKSLINFKYGNTIPVIGTKPRASECKITGTLEMGDYNFSQSDIDLINSFNKSSQDINLNIKFPYANILIKTPESMVAGQTIEISSEIYSDNKDNSNNSYVEYVFVEETNDQNAQLVNYDTGKRYNRLSEETLLTYRNGGISIINNFETRTAEITVKEVICNEDTQMLIAAIVNTGTGDKFDVTNLLIKDPTYAINGVINGISSLNESGASYVYELMLTSNKGYEPIGTVDITWSLSGEGIEYVEYYEISDDKKALTIKTKNEMPDLETLTSELNITVLVENYDGISEKYGDFTINKTVLLLNETIILTDISNKEVMEVCRNQNWASNPNALTKEEASRISDIGQAFSGISNTKWSFDEFEYFTNVSVLSDNAFAGSKLTSIILPSNVTKIGKSIFEGCNELKNVKLSENITEIPSKAFHGCYKLEYFTLPKKVLNIESNAFGNVGIEKILFEGVETNTPKTIFIQKESSLWSIKNNAFENEEWKINRSDISTISTTNVLNEVSIPNGLILSTDKYNFLLSPGLNKINLESDNTKVYLENDILYTDNSKTQIVRALVGTNEEVKDLDLSNITNVFAYAFYNCKNINKVIFGELLKPYGLETGAFYGCTLKEIDLEKAVNLAILNDFTFSNATELDTIKLPQNGWLHTLGYQLFVNCPLTNGVVLPNTIEHCITMGTNLPYGRQFFRCGISNLVLPDGLHKLPMYFIDECHKLSEITFGKYFTTNYDNAYSIITRCNSLSVVNLPLYSTTLDKNGYYVYKTEIDSNNNLVRNIKSGPYEDLNSANQFIGELEGTPQYDSGKTSYEAVLLSSGTTLIINTELFKKGRLELIESCYNLNSYNLQDNDDNQIFAKDEDNNIFRTGVVVDNNIIPNNGTLVKIVNNIVNYTVPEKYTVIEYGAFSQSNKLKTVSLHNNITNIGMGAFSYCTSLEDINLSNLDKVKVIEEDMFAGCENLVDVKLSNEVITIKSQAFMNCRNLQTINIPEKVDIINNDLFNGCANLKEIIIPQNVKYIEQYAFNECSLLSSVKILSRVLSYINKFAFCGCKKLNEILLLNVNAPEIIADNEYYDGYGASNEKDDNGKVIKVKKFHPFGYNYSTFVGSGNSINNLYLPYNAQGYDVENWEIPLKKISKFEVNTITLDNSCILKGSILEDKPLIYFKSESGEFKNNGEVESSDNNEGTFHINFNGKVYDNEKIYVYTDKSCENYIGEFVAEYGKGEYILGDVTMGSLNTRSMFNTNLFEDENKTNNTDVEMANITKLEYDILVSRVNQLMKLLNKK